MNRPRTTIADALERFCTEHPRAEYTSKDLIDGALTLVNVERWSVMPYDYCYNHENLGSADSKLFLRVARGRYRFVGRQHSPSAATAQVTEGSPSAIALVETLTALGVDLDAGRDLPREFEYSSLPLALADAVFSLALRYHEQCVPVVRAFAQWLDVPLERGGATVTSSEALERLRTLQPDELPTAFGGKRYRTSTQSGILKAEAVLMALELLAAHGINTFDDMRHDNPSLKDVEAAFARIPGQSRLTAWKYFVMLAGNEDGVKPDRHLLGFVAHAFSRPTVTDAECTATVSEVAHLLRAERPWMTPRRLDFAIWDHCRKNRMPWSDDVDGRQA